MTHVPILQESANVIAMNRNEKMDRIYFYINPENHKNFLKDKLSTELDILDRGKVYPVVFERSTMLLPQIEYEGRRCAGLTDIRDYLHEIIGNMIIKSRENLNECY